MHRKLPSFAILGFRRRGRTDFRREKRRDTIPPCIQGPLKSTVTAGKAAIGESHPTAPYGRLFVPTPGPGRAFRVRCVVRFGGDVGLAFFFSFAHTIATFTFTNSTGISSGHGSHD
jgi:hypothetical protein